MEDKIAFLRPYNGKRMRFEADTKEGNHITVEGTVKIITVCGRERVYITDSTGYGIYINTDEMEMR